jgi:hypothetical protein
MTCLGALNVTLSYRSLDALHSRFINSFHSQALSQKAKAVKYFFFNEPRGELTRMIQAHGPAFSLEIGLGAIDALCLAPTASNTPLPPRSFQRCQECRGSLFAPVFPPTLLFFHGRALVFPGRIDFCNATLLARIRGRHTSRARGEDFALSSP